MTLDNNQDQSNLSWGAVAVCFVLALVAMTFFSQTSLGRMTASSGDSTTLETVTVAETEAEVELRVSRTDDVFDADGNKLIRAYFKGGDDEVVCEIPENRASDFSEDAIYKATVHYWYVDEIYSDFIESNTTQYETAADAAANEGSIARVVASVDFMYSNYIVDGTETEEEATEKFIELFCESSDGTDSAK